MGTLRQLPSKRYQAIIWDRGKQVTIGTFKTKSEAKARIAAAETDRTRGQWDDPRKKKRFFGPYALEWLEGHRSAVGPRTWVNYEASVRLYVLPTFGETPIVDIDSASIRVWHAKLRSPEGPGNTAAAKAYARLSQILATAVRDEIIDVNRANVKGGRNERSAPRPEVDVDQAMAIIAAANPRIRPLVLLALGTGLRRNELRGLRQKYLDLDAGTVQVLRSWDDDEGGSFSTVKTDTSLRILSLPEAIIPALRVHLASLQHPGPNNVVFPATTAWGNHTEEQAERPFSVGFLNDSWCEAVTAVFGPQVDEKGKKLPGAVHLHDIRHTSLTLAAAGAALKDLMTRGGHRDTRIAMGYQNKTQPKNDQLIADRMSAAFQESVHGGAVLGVLPCVEVVGPEHDGASVALDGDPSFVDKTAHIAIALP